MAATHAHTKASAVWFKDLARWDIKTAKVVEFNRSHPSFRPLKDFAEEVTELVRPWEDPEKQWPVYGVNNVEGIVFSHNQLGKTFNAAYKKICKDWFFHNPTRANVGSLGRVPDVPSDAITSPEYQVWRIREGLTPDFMEVLLSTQFFQDQVDFHRVGAVKQRLFTENLLQIRIPTLPIQLQSAIVTRKREAQSAAAKSWETMAQQEAKIQNGIYTALGMKLPETERPLPKVFALRWKNLERWSVDFLLRNEAVKKGSECRFPRVKLGEVARISYGIQKCPANRPGRYSRPYLRVANVQRGELDLQQIKYIEVPENELETFRLLSGDLLVCEGNSADLVGRPAMWNGEIPNCVHQNHILRVRVDENKALPLFVLEYMSSFYARMYFRSRAKFTTNLASINSNDLRDFPLPLPPLAIQKEIVDMVSDQRKRIAEERKIAAARQSQAVRDVDEMILGVKSVRQQQS